VTLIAEHPRGEEIGGVLIRPLKARKGWRRRLFSSFEAYRAALGTPAEIHHFHDPDLIPWMLLLKAGGRKVVYDIHENYAARFGQWGFPEPFGRLLAAGYGSLERFAVRRFDGIVTVSETMADLYKDSARESVTVRYVVDLPRLEEAVLSFEKPGHPVVYTSGTNSPARNCLQTVGALPAVLQRHPETRLQFAGRYHPAEYDKVLLKRARELGVEEHVQLLGHLPWIENFRRTSEAWIGCVFYEDNPSNRVGIPNRLFEYMYCGVAVLAHDFPELRRIVEETGCGTVVDSSSPDSVAESLVRLLDDPGEVLEMGRRGREAVLAKHNFGADLAGLTSFYGRILERGA